MGRPDDLFVTAWERDRAALEQYARRSCGDRATAEDVVATAFTALLRQLRERAVDDIRSYIWQAVRNELRGRHRRRQWEDDANGRYATTLLVAPADMATDGLVVWEAVRSLPWRSREVVTLRYLARLTEVEIAQVLNVKLGTVKSRLTRAREILTPLLREVHSDG